MLINHRTRTSTMNLIPNKKKLFLFHLGNNMALWYDLGITALLTEFSQWWYAVSYAFALATSIFLLFFYYILFVFSHVNGNFFKRFRNFAVLVIIVYALNWSLVVLLTEHTKLHYIASILVVGTFIALFTYHLNEYFVFYN